MVVPVDGVTEAFGISFTSSLRKSNFSLSRTAFLLQQITIKGKSYRWEGRIFFELHDLACSVAASTSDCINISTAFAKFKPNNNGRECC